MATLKINNSIIKTVIFDFDGTLAKLNIDFNHMRESVLEIIYSYGIAQNQMSTNYVLEMIRAAKNILEQKSPPEAEIFQGEAMNFIEELEVNAAKTGELFPQTKEMLTRLKLHKITVGVVSRNCEKAIHMVFPDILFYCDTVVSRDIVKNVKPHPEQINTALLRLNQKAGQALMIGDHPLDITSGKCAGTFTAGVLTGNFKEADFFQAGADIVLSQASYLLNIIK